MIVALAGGVGAARMLNGLVAVVPPEDITAVVNTGDDTVLHGLHISPDLDTVTYTLAGMINPETGWGLRGETWSAMAEVRELSGGRLSWFNLGDHDLGTHMFRTSRRSEGAPLSRIAAEIADRWGLGLRILPMTDDRVETRIILAEGGEIGFQEYFVGARHDVPVQGIRLAGIDDARPAPGVLDAIGAADTVVICPSNPVVSIGPVLAVPGIGPAVEGRREAAVAVSPIIAGKALKGPADRMLTELGHESSVAGVARMWAPYAATLVIDEADADRAGDVEAAGMRAVVGPTVMSGPQEAAALARLVLGAAVR
ncbi:MAG TPA: 2-phospho-L-lactate transferase [Acidimicrobiales bacterium]|jgi:LPPG:FO 2-phospho-L-lactate transferase|nr:2-phospho-L-lactate transferase [Acidimicrobiales bacterium]